MEGSAKYLAEDKKSSRISRMSLIYLRNTCEDFINISQLREKIDENALANSEATHIVTKIQWGANCTVTCEFDSADVSVFARK